MAIATHAIMIPAKVAAKNIDSLTRSSKSATDDLDNGNLVQLNTGVSTAYGEREVYLATKPATDSLGGLWMVGEPEVDVTDGKYKGIDVNVRYFFNAAGQEFSVFKPKLYDIVYLTDEAFTNTRGTKTFASAADSTYQLTWVTSATSGATSFRLVSVGYISVPVGHPGSDNRVTAYRLECISE
jgi:hypothetical protein